MITVIYALVMGILGLCGEISITALSINMLCMALLFFLYEIAGK